MSLLAGCVFELPDPASGINGWTDYEDRLEATKAEFAYFTLLDQNLSPAIWEKDGVALRVPKPFQPVALAVQKPSEEHVFSREVLGVPLPGVLGAWQALRPGKDGQEPHTAYLFVMSNHHLWAYSRASAMAFHQSLVEDVLAELKGLSRLPIASGWASENHSGHGQPYAIGTFQATLPHTESKADFTLFLFQHGTNERRNEIKVALLFVVPREAEPSGSAAEVDPKALSAQTLRITPRPMESP